MYHGFDVVNEALMLNLSCVLHALFDLHWVRIDLSSELSCYLDLYMGLGNVILQD